MRCATGRPRNVSACVSVCAPIRPMRAPVWRYLCVCTRACDNALTHAARLSPAANNTTLAGHARSHSPRTAAIFCEYHIQKNINVVYLLRAIPSSGILNNGLLVTMRNGVYKTFASQSSSTINSIIVSTSSIERMIAFVRWRRSWRLAIISKCVN